jgi:anti-sigma factor (TIGR02949 family)
MNVPSIDNGSCETYRQYFDAYLDHELPVETQRAVQQHVASCSGCARILDNRGRMKQLVRQAVANEQAPLELVEAVRGRFQSDSRSFFSRNFAGGMVAAAAVLLLAIGGISLVRWGRIAQQNTNGSIFQAVSARMAEMFRVGLEDHIHCAIDNKRWKQIVSFQEMKIAEGPAALGPDFIDLVPEVASKLGKEYQIVGGHRCNTGERKYVHLLMTGANGSVLSLVITEKRSGETFTKTDALAVLKSAEVDIYQDRQDDLTVAGFESEKYLAYVVSNLDRGANLNIASSLAPVVYGHLHRLEL